MADMDKKRQQGTRRGRKGVEVGIERCRNGTRVVERGREGGGLEEEGSAPTVRTRFCSPGFPARLFDNDVHVDRATPRFFLDYN